MYTDDVESTDFKEFDPIIKNFISEVYIIHTSGIVKFAKSFGHKRHFEPQLIGSFVTAIEQFMEVTSRKLNNDDIKLTDIGTNGSRWFMKKSKSVLLVAIVPTSSKFLQMQNGFELIGEICTELMTTFTYQHMDKVESHDFKIPPGFEQDVTLTILEKIKGYDLV